MRELERYYSEYRAIEVGPNTILTGLFRSTKVKCYPSGSVAHIQTIQKELIDE